MSRMPTAKEVEKAYKILEIEKAIKQLPLSEREALIKRITPKKPNIAALKKKFLGTKKK